MRIEYLVVVSPSCLCTCYDTFSSVVVSAVLRDGSLLPCLLNGGIFSLLGVCGATYTRGFSNISRRGSGRLAVDLVDELRVVVLDVGLGLLFFPVGGTVATKIWYRTWSFPMRSVPICSGSRSDTYHSRHSMKPHIVSFPFGVLPLSRDVLPILWGTLLPNSVGPLARVAPLVHRSI